MNWLLSILIGILTAVVSCFLAGFVAMLCVKWYRISSFEGGSGYFVILIALLGTVAGFIVGLISARIVAGSDAPTFLRGLGLALGSAGALSLIGLVVARLCADVAPEIDGHSLELAIEVRGREGFTVPKPEPMRGATASVYLPGGRNQPRGFLRLDQARQEDGRWIIPGTVPLVTSIATKYLIAYFDDELDVTFPLRLRSHPNRSDLEWSKWAESAWDARKPEPPPEGKFGLRYRVQLVQPPPPGPTAEEVAAKEAAVDQARFESVKPDASIPDWFPYTRYGAPDDRRRIALQHIISKSNYVAELSALMTAKDEQVASEALRLVEHIPQPPPELLGAVTKAGRELAELMRQVNATTAEQDPGYTGAAGVSVRFSAWMVAVRALREKAGGDFTPELRTILELARVRDDSQALRQDVLRVASYYMQQWTGLEPLPTDPKPR